MTSETGLERTEINHGGLKEKLGWSHSSTVLLAGFLLTILLIAYFWWPLAVEYLAYIDWEGSWWLYIDWLLIGIFLFMTLAIVTKANLQTDIFIILVGLAGGLIIESWGTQTELWTYYTAERPPLWIIPAWPIASLTIDRITHLLSHWTDHFHTQIVHRLFRIGFAGTGLGFMVLMVVFVFPTIDKSLTQFSIILCFLIFISERNPRTALLTFAAGSGLGYFLEVWGTTRECWTYYTNQTPPLFAVFAHGMAAVAFWRGNLITQSFRRWLLRARINSPI